MRFSVDGLEFSYRSRRTLNGITMEVREKEMVSILGPNGAGKTTLLRCMNDILHPGYGEVRIDERTISSMCRRDVAKELSYVPQRGEVSRMTVFESVLLGRRPHMGIDVSEKDLRITGKVIELVGLGHLSSKYVDEISGGEHQLVLVARSFVQQPKVVLLDEPTSNLDPSNQHMIMNVVQKVVKNNGMAAVMVVHDLNLAIRHSDKFILMKNGEIFSSGGIEVITPENIMEVYNIDTFVEEVHGIPVVIPKNTEGNT